MNAQLSCSVEWLTAEHDSVPTRRSLLSRLRNVEDNISWQEFFDTYWRLIYNLARKSGLREEEAEDVVQETVIAVARRLPEFRYDPAKGSFKQWLLVITRRRIQDHLRRIYRSLPSDAPSPAETKSRTENVPDPELSPDASVDAAWEEEWHDSIFQRALVRLRELAQPKHYQVFDLCVLHQVPPAEVARMLGLSRAQVYLSKHRSVLCLRRIVSDLRSDSERGSGI